MAEIIARHFCVRTSILVNGKTVGRGVYSVLDPGLVGGITVPVIGRIFELDYRPLVRIYERTVFSASSGKCLQADLQALYLACETGTDGLEFGFESFDSVKVL
jgi:hypothetical protein